MILTPVLVDWACWCSLEHLQQCSVRPAKILFTSKFNYLLFSKPFHKTKTANRWETTNNNPPGPIKLSNQSTARQALLCLLPALANCAKLLGHNHFAEPNWHVLTFFIKF
jgi:hypothetical protein